MPVIGEYWLGICDICRVCKQFGNPQARDMWQLHHPHESRNHDHK